MDLCFDHEQEVYFSGQFLSGKLTFNLAKPISGDLIIKFQCQSETSFNKNINKRHSLSYNGAENHLDEIVHSSQRIFNTGKHELPIIFSLPANLPSSYEGPHGYTRIWCKAVLTHSEAKKIICSKLFTVIKPLNLNCVKNYNVSLSASDKWASRDCCIIRKDFQQMECSVTKSGFVSGDIISVYCTIDNQRSKPILSLEVTLKQTVKFTGKTSKSDEHGFKEVAFCACSIADQCPIEAFGSKKCNLKIKIPPLPPSFQTKLIEISYSVEVKCGKRLKANLPITIGTNIVGQTIDDLEQIILRKDSVRKVDALFSDQSSIPVFKDCILSNCQGKFKNKDAEFCLNELTFVPKCLYYEIS